MSTSPPPHLPSHFQTDTANLVGAPLSGYLSDRALIRAKSTRKSHLWIPEDRLLSTTSGSLFLVPLTTLGMGAALRWIEDPVWGVGLSMVMLGVHGVGLVLVSAPVATYCVDIMRRRSAEVIAAN